MEHLTDDWLTYEGGPCGVGQNPARDNCVAASDDDEAEDQRMIEGAGDEWHPLVGIMGETDDMGQVRRAVGAIWRVANLPAEVATKIAEAADLPEPVARWGGRGAALLDWIVPGVPAGSVILASTAVGVMGARQAANVYKALQKRIADSKEQG